VHRFQEGRSGHVLDTSFQGGGRASISHHLVSTEATAEAAEQLQTAFTIFLEGNIVSVEWVWQWEGSH